MVLQPGEEDNGKPLGVEYIVKCFVADHDEDRGHKRSSVSLAIKKVCLLTLGSEGDEVKNVLIVIYHNFFYHP